MKQQTGYEDWPFCDSTNQADQGKHWTQKTETKTNKQKTNRKSNLEEMIIQEEENKKATSNVSR